MPSVYRPFTSKELKPAGWLRRQLKTEAEGLVGNLDKVWPDIRDSAWIGGDREGWERVPYWLDGAVPLAYLLEDEDLIVRVKRYIDAILDRQEEDGWICPCTKEQRYNYDTWAIQLISKVFVRYYECSGDERIPTVLYRLMKNYYDELIGGTARIRDWSEYRWFEGFPALNFLAERYDDAWIGELAKLLKEKGTDYTKLTHLWEKPDNTWCFERHIVNLTMMLKSEVLSHELLNEPYENIGGYLYDYLKKYNGTAVGLFTGDECLSGLSPIQGSELCSVVELSDSLIQLYAHTGDPVWAERLERVVFNALPATISEDMWTHQYLQLANQINCTLDWRWMNRSIFGTNSAQAHRFGLEPHFGCCTANMGQGWPKLALATFMKSEDGVASAVPLPSEVITEWEGTAVKISLATDYPFRNTFTYRVEADAKTSMALRVRIPSFAKNLTVNGAPKRKKSELVFRGFKKGVTEITISYTCEPHFESRPNRMHIVVCGSIVYALPIKEVWCKHEYSANGVERKYPYCDYNLYGESDWNYGFASRTLTLKEGTIAERPFSAANPPLTVSVDMSHIDWGYEPRYHERFCAKIPQSRVPLDAPQTMTLIPYGCARLRMTEIPFVKETDK